MCNFTEEPGDEKILLLILVVVLYLVWLVLKEKDHFFTASVSGPRFQDLMITGVPVVESEDETTNLWL